MVVWSTFPSLFAQIHFHSFDACLGWDQACFEEDGKIVKCLILGLAVHKLTWSLFVIRASRALDFVTLCPPSFLLLVLHPRKEDTALEINGDRER